jgi:replication protein
MIVTECQEVLHDKRKSGKERPWALYKLSNGYVAMAYDEVDKLKAERLRNCASWLEFTKTEGGLKLHNANFCRVRLCPICQWRRSLKTFGQVYKIVSVAQHDYAFIFLTLTVKNCEGMELKGTLDELSKSWDRFIKYKDIKNIVKGFYRGTEVTHNLTDNTYHPHFHCLLAVNKSYFTSRDYLSQPKWRALWRKAARLNYDPQVDVRRVKADKVDGVCAEVAKYAVKVSDVICFDDWDLTVDTVATLDKALDKRRFISFGGVFKEIHKQLNLDDVEQGDLVHENDSELPDVSKDTVLYAWNTGYNQYVRSK